jgi:dUTP pyrophosphatase
MSEYLDHTQTLPLLKIAFVGNNPSQWNELYTAQIEKHNTDTLKGYYNAGFDLIFPEDIVIEANQVSMASMKVKCEMVDSKGNPLSYYMYPRSSISKTPLMLANHVGIIDSGYRGEIIGAFACARSSSDYKVYKYTRLLQLCHPSLSPFLVKLVDASELSVTERGEGGFGSTGK